LYQSRLIDDDDDDDDECSSQWNEGKGKPYLEKICPGATSSTTNLTLPVRGSNLGCHGGNLVINLLSYGMALLLVLVWNLRF
jgi:hypothetical protein